MESRRTRTDELRAERVVAARTALPASGQWRSWPVRPQSETKVVA